MIENHLYLVLLIVPKLIIVLEMKIQEGKMCLNFFTTLLLSREEFISMPI